MFDSKEIIIGALAILFTFVALCGLSYVDAMFESKVFNECTGSNTSTWDAVFTELRVIDCKKK
jgi:hypothetical protein